MTKNMIIVCGIPDCETKVFHTIEDFESHWRSAHLEQYGWEMHGVHPKIIMNESPLSTKEGVKDSLYQRGIK